MAKVRRLDDRDNPDRWMVSYADFITLLLAFFVVMYSISSVNEGKYRDLSSALSGAFNIKAAVAKEHDSLPESKDKGSFLKLSVPDPSEDIEMVQFEPLPRADLLFVAPQNAGLGGVDAVLSDVEQLINEQPQGGGQKVPDLSEMLVAAELERIANNIQNRLGDALGSDLIRVRQKEHTVEIEIRSQLLFRVGSAEITADNLDILNQVANIMRERGNKISVEGFTDNIPIKTSMFPSNWELSAARSASVVRRLETLGINSSRLSAIGYGEQHPIAGNETRDGRNKNRRVVLVVHTVEDATKRL